MNTTDSVMPPAPIVMTLRCFRNRTIIIITTNSIKALWSGSRDYNFKFLRERHFIFLPRLLMKNPKIALIIVKMRPKCRKRPSCTHSQISYTKK